MFIIYICNLANFRLIHVNVIEYIFQLKKWKKFVITRFNINHDSLIMDLNLRFMTLFESLHLTGKKCNEN